MKLGRCKLCNRYLKSPEAEHGPVCARKESSSIRDELKKVQELTYRGDIKIDTLKVRKSIQNNEIIATDIEKFNKNGGGLIWSILNLRYSGERVTLPFINKFMAVEYHFLMSGIYTQIMEDLNNKDESFKEYKLKLEDLIETYTDLVDRKNKK